jgi:three-Cys-motif partner protein
MGAPSTTVWQLDPHTRAKHEILKRYLEAWTAILGGSGFPVIAYVDGFAGPGRYAGGEDGSPVIALKAALQHRERIRAELRFLFIEEKPKRARCLEQVLSEMPLPKNFRFKVVPGATFEKAFRDTFLDPYQKRGKRLPPSFLFIDPFGWTGAPFALVKEVLSQPSCEVLINFMYEEINRFIALPHQAANFDALFGTDEWRPAGAMTKPAERNRFLHDLYLRQLRGAARAKYVRSFEMRNDRDVTDYFLFFATNNAKGMSRMKDAMWKVDPSGELRFSDATDPRQTLLFDAEPDLAALERGILSAFVGPETTVGEIEQFVLADTPFRETHCKRVLAQLERATPQRLVALNPRPRRRPGTFADPKLRVRLT